MRYIATNNLREGHVLAMDLVFSRDTVLLRKGKTLTSSLIQKIALLGYQGLYIEDELSAGIEIDDVINPDLRIKTRSELELMFHNVEFNVTSSVKDNIRSIQSLAKEIVDEILHNRETMINIIDLRNYDDYTYSHSLNVTVLSVVMGTAMGLSRDMIYELAVGALIHDTGKMFIPKDILHKPGRLTPEEYEEIKKHSELGYRYLLNNYDLPEGSMTATLHHHEQYNGGGYPSGLKGEEIHLFGRIISAADVYDALTSDRPYREAMLPSDAIEYIMAGYNTMFDPEIVMAITQKVAPYPIGTCVRLSTGQIGIVVKNYETTSLRPMIRLIEDNRPTDKCIDLTNDRSTLNITVQEIINI